MKTKIIKIYNWLNAMLVVYTHPNKPKYIQTVKNIYNESRR